MASIVLRHTVRFTRRIPAISTARAYSDHAEPKVEPHKGKVASDKVKMPDGLGHAVGVDRFERLAHLAGNQDPWEVNIMKAPGGTKENPTAIASVFDSRVVGCICEEDALHIKWMDLNKGEAKRCECGYWFQLTELKHEDYGQ